MPRQEKVRHARTQARHTTLSLHDPLPVDTHQVKFNSATAPREAIVDTTAATGETGLSLGDALTFTPGGSVEGHKRVAILCTE